MTIDSTTCERPWCLCDVGDQGIQLNQEHPLVSPLSEEQRREIVDYVREFREGICKVDLDWIDQSSSEASQWQSVYEMLVNKAAWNYISSNHPEWTGATVDAVLTSAGLAPVALACLDEDDQDSLAFSLAAATADALQEGLDVTEVLRDELIGWLQDWAETDDEDLATLVGLAQSMSCPRQQEDAVNWSEEGF